MGSGGRLAQVVMTSESDVDDSEAGPSSPAEPQILPSTPDDDCTSQRPLKKPRIAEEIIVAAEPLAVADPPSSEDEEATIEEEPHPIGDVIRVSGRGAGRWKHYESFGYDGIQYNLEDPVLLVPDEPTQKPNMAIIKDITQTAEGSMMVTGQRFYRPGEAETEDGGFWQSNSTRELFYSFHQEEFPAECVMHKFVVHFISSKKKIPPRTKHPGFVVQKIYYTKQKQLFELKDAGANEEEEIDLLVQKTKSRLGDLPDIEP